MHGLTARETVARFACMSSVASFVSGGSRAMAFAMTLAMLVTAGVGCSDDSTGADDADVASIRLFVNQADVSDHIALNAGYAQRIEVRLYAADGRRITGLDDRFEVVFAFNPTSLAGSAAVGGRPLEKDVTPFAPPEEAGNLSVTVSRPEHGTSQTFGPFGVLIH
jgi:hypothetical protein